MDFEILGDCYRNYLVQWFLLSQNELLMPCITLSKSFISLTVILPPRISGICDRLYSSLGGFPSFHFRILEILSSTHSADFALTFTSGNHHFFSQAISLSVRRRVSCHSVCSTLRYSESNCCLSNSWIFS